MTDWPAWAWIEEPPPRPAHESVTMTRSPTLSGAARGARTAATLIAAGEAVRKGGGSRYLRRSDGGGSLPIITSRRASDEELFTIIGLRSSAITAPQVPRTATLTYRLAGSDQGCGGAGPASGSA